MYCIVIVGISVFYHLSTCQARPGLLDFVNVSKLTLTPLSTYFQSTNRQKHASGTSIHDLCVEFVQAFGEGNQRMHRQYVYVRVCTCNRRCGQSALQEMLALLTCAPTCLQNHSHAPFQMLAVGPLKSGTEWAEFVVDSGAHNQKACFDDLRFESLNNMSAYYVHV